MHQVTPPCIFEEHIELSCELIAKNPLLVVVDGEYRVGKSNIARYLGWRNRMTVIELDCYIRKSSENLEHDLNSINTIIENRLKTCRPTIVEGYNSLGILLKLNKKIDYIIFVETPPNNISFNSDGCGDEYYKNNTTHARCECSINAKELHPNLKQWAHFKVQGYSKSCAYVSPIDLRK